MGYGHRPGSFIRYGGMVSVSLQDRGHRAEASGDPAEICGDDIGAGSGALQQSAGYDGCTDRNE